MGTETDVYKVDTREAVDAINRLAEALEGTKKSAVETGEAAGKSAAFWSAALKGATVAANELWGVMKDSVAAAMEQEKADRQLSAVAGESTEAFKAQASALQSALGVSDDMVQGMQTLALRMGAAREQVLPMTKAVLDYAAVTGSDATAAMEQLIRGVEQGTGKIKGLALQYEATGNFTEDMNRATAALAERWQGGAAAAAETFAGRVEILKGEVGELKEGFGNLLIKMVEGTGIVSSLAEAFRAMREAEETDAMAERTAADAELVRQRGELIDKIRAFHKEHPQGVGLFDIELSTLNAQLMQVDKQISKAKEAREAGDRSRMGVVATGGGRDHQVGKAGKDDLSDEQFRLDMLALDKAMAEEAEKEAKKKAERRKAILEKENADRKAAAKRGLEDEREAAKARLEVVEDEQRRKKEMMREFEDFARGAANQLIGLATEQFRSMMLDNTQFTAAYKAKAMERELVGLDEEEAHKRKSEIIKRTEAEEAAAQQKKTAEVLANIAIEAGVRAAFCFAEAAAAFPLVPVMVEKAAAGVAFAAIAVGTGITAAGISGSRGMTSDERQKLESLEDRDKSRNTRESKQAGQKAANIGTVINVINMGITGQTRTAQARELRRLENEYDGLSVGSAGG